MSNECSQCPNGSDAEWYRSIAAVFDVRKARQIVGDGRGSQVVPPAWLRGAGLPLDPPDEQWHEDENGRRYQTLSMGIYVNEEHLAHIPEDKLSEPVIILPFRIWSKREKNDLTVHLLIDGSHRATRLYREGKEVRAYLMTEAEAISVCTNRESNWWKKKPRARKTARSREARA